MKKYFFLFLLIILSACSRPVIVGDTSNLDTLISQAEARKDTNAVKLLTLEKCEKLIIAGKIQKQQAEINEKTEDAGKFKGIKYAVIVGGIIFALLVAGFIIRRFNL